VEDAAASLLGIERPYLLVDVEPRLRSRAELCVLAREELAKAAKAQWAADCEGGQEVLALPPLYDATSARAALRLAQEVDGECSDLIWQKRKELDPNLEKRRPRVSRTARALRPTEAAEFRLAPTDGLLEKQVLFAVCALWVPVLPDSPAPGEEGGVSWRRWLFDYCHCT